MRAEINKARAYTVFQAEEAAVVIEVSMCHLCAGVAAAKLQASLNKSEKCCSCSACIDAAVRHYRLQRAETTV